jgi:DNA-3-methyladenine glycosylase I
MAREKEISPETPLEKPTSYCDYVSRLESGSVNRLYHDTQYGFPIENDDELFGRLILEINQAGLSWTTILNKQENFRRAYSEFNIQKIAAYTDIDRERLLNDAGIIRNRLKINAAIHNAQQVVDIQRSFGSFQNWLAQNYSPSLEDWVRLFKRTFKFTGGEIVNEFLMSIGYLKGAHVESCPIHAHIKDLNPFWKNRFQNQSL